MHLDYSIKSLNERMILVNKILEEQRDRIEKYFGSPSVNYLLQGLANYILDCDHKQTHKEKKQDSFEKSTFELTGESQYTLYHKIKIDQSDYENAAIKEKRDLIVRVFNKYGLSNKAKKWIQDLKYDQIMIKQSEVGYIKPQFTIQMPSCPAEYEIDNYWADIFEITSDDILSNLDLFEKDSWRTILKVLPYGDGKISGNIDRLIKVFNKVSASCQFTELQKNIIREYRIGACNQFDDFKILRNKDIQQRLKIKQNTLSDNIDSICNKLISAYEKAFTDYYYTYLVRGVYKKCSKCGQNKLMSDFKSNPTSKDGKYSICKDCLV